VRDLFLPAAVPVVVVDDAPSDAAAQLVELRERPGGERDGIVIV
jgi:hypothetical protein